MIELARDLLADLGLLDRATRPRVNVALSRGASLSAEVYLGAHEFVYVKASELERLDQEYQAIGHARSLYAELVPEPLTFTSREGWDILMTRGVKSTALAMQHLDSQPVRAALVGFFRESARHALKGQKGHAWLLEALSEDPASAPWAERVVRCVGTDGLHALAALPRIAQHGDFTRNNLGVTRSGVVVFDWEDFGVSLLPGLDLCALLISLAEGEADAFRNLACAPGGPIGTVVDDACAALGIEPGTFRRLIPLYVLHFLQLKARYGAALQGSLRRLLDSLLVH